MISELLQDRAALYACGAMTAAERDAFELVLEFHHELRDFVAGLTEVGAALTLANLPAHALMPPQHLKAQILAKIADRPQSITPPGLVVSDPGGLVEWISPGFTALCGYTIEEVRGKKLGPILQGEKTDRDTAERMRRAVHEHRPCHETILNYHKDGSPYWVEIAITPILDDAQQPLWLIARERELADRPAA
jgi:PAS domain S-box-containing protein